MADVAALLLSLRAGVIVIVRDIDSDADVVIEAVEDDDALPVNDVDIVVVTVIDGDIDDVSLRVIDAVYDCDVEGDIDGDGDGNTSRRHFTPGATSCDVPVTSGNSSAAPGDCNASARIASLEMRPLHGYPVVNAVTAPAPPPRNGLPSVTHDPTCAAACLGYLDRYALTTRPPML